MSWAGCYVLTLSCDGSDDAVEVDSDSRKGTCEAGGHHGGRNVGEWTAEHGSECRRRARKAGWRWNDEGRCWCPTCWRVRQAERGAMRPSQMTMEEYRDGLRLRVCRVACPHCGAKVGELCIGQYAARTKGFHVARSDAAKCAGHVKGRRWHRQSA